MINAIIIDDEQHCIDRLKDLLIADHSAWVQLIGISQTVEEGIKLITSIKPDLIFLDVSIIICIAYS